MSWFERIAPALGRIARDVVRAGLRQAERSVSGRSRTPRPDRQPRTPQPGTATAQGAYPGDFVGLPNVEYAPHQGDLADPGEVVWTWVPFEEDFSRGKDRPVLIVARDGVWLLGLPLTSKDHDRDARQEAFEGRFWVDIGTGAWDTQGRPSEVRVNRVVRVDPGRLRRISGRLDERRFLIVAAEMRRRLA